MALVGNLSASLGTGKIVVTGSLEPDLNNQFYIGTTSKKWSNIVSTAFSGSLTKLADGTSDYLVAGTNVTLSTGSNGAVTINATSVSTPAGGADRNIQFNNAGAFDGDDELSWSGTVLAVTGSVSASQGITGSNVFATSLTSTQVVFADAGGKLSGDSGLTYDKNNDILTGVVVKATTGFSGSLTKLTDGTSYLIAGTGIQITTGSSGAVTVTSTVTATTPSAPVRSIQFNEAGAFGGDDELIWTGTVLAVTGSVSASQGITGSNVFATSLTNGNVVLAGAGGKLTGSSGFSYVTIGSVTNVDLVGDLSASYNVKAQELYAASLNSGEIVVAGASGILDGSSNLTFTAGTLGVTGNVSATLGLTGSDLFATNLTNTQVVYAGAGGKLSSDAGMTYNAGSDVLTVGTSTFGQNVTIAGDLTVNGTTTTINTDNLLVEDKVVLLASGATGPDVIAGIAIYSGSTSATNNDLVIGTIQGNTWAVGTYDTQYGTQSQLISMTLTPMRASQFEVKNGSAGTGGGASTVIKTDGSALIASGSSVALSGSTSIDFVRGGTRFAYVGASTDVSPLDGLFPSTDNLYNLGSPALRWKNVYTGDLHLRNERGDYTLIEEEDFLSIRFNKTGKRYKFVLERVPELDEK